MQISSWPEGLPRPGNQRLKRLESATPWFEVYQVSAGTFALLEPRHYEEPISYLTLGDERAVLFDTGMGVGNLRAEVEQLIHPQDMPLFVVNSHSHFDHVGDDHRFSEVWAFDDESEIAHKEAYAPKEMLARTLEAFEQIAAGDAPFEIRDSIRIHRFEGFGVLLPA